RSLTQSRQIENAGQDIRIDRFCTEGILGDSADSEAVISAADDSDRVSRLDGPGSVDIEIRPGFSRKTELPNEGIGLVQPPAQLEAGDARTGNGESHFVADREYVADMQLTFVESPDGQDRKSTRLNSSHVKISYAVFCLKKKKKN